MVRNPGMKNINQTVILIIFLLLLLSHHFIIIEQNLRGAITHQATICASDLFTKTRFNR